MEVVRSRDFPDSREAPHAVPSDQLFGASRWAKGKSGPAARLGLGMVFAGLGLNFLDKRQRLGFLEPQTEAVQRSGED